MSKLVYTAPKQRRCARRMPRPSRWFQAAVSRVLVFCLLGAVAVRAVELEKTLPENTTIPGAAAAVHDEAQVYSLPYAAGSSFRVTQGYHGNFSHQGQDEYAIDWKMPLGTPVLAARAGVVVKSRDNFARGGNRRCYLNAANFLVIQHSDGTLGLYAHLAKGGNKVKVGDRVKAGDPIALSGNTGFTSGPHLHFSVFTTRNGMERVSLPVKFRTLDHREVDLVAGQNYQAPASETQLASRTAATLPATP